MLPSAQRKALVAASAALVLAALLAMMSNNIKPMHQQQIQLEELRSKGDVEKNARSGRSSNVEDPPPTELSPKAEMEALSVRGFALQKA